MFLPSQCSIKKILIALCGGITSLFAQEGEPLTIEALLQQGRFEEALPRVEELEVEWNYAVRDNDSFEYRIGWAKSLLLLGMVEDRLNKYESALKHLRLARDLAVEGEAGPHTLGDTFDSLGRAEAKAGQYAEAEKSLLEAIEQRGQLNLAQREPWLSASRDHLGLLYLTTGRYEEAGKIFHETLAVAGDDKEVLAQRHGYLGKYFHTMRSYAKASEHLERALEFAGEAWGEEHHSVISLTGQLGLAHLRLGANKRARELLTRAATLTRKQPKSHQASLALATYLSNLGNLELEEHEYERAREIFVESLSILTPRLGDTSPVLAPFYNNIGFANQHLDNFEAAQDAYHQAAVRYRYSVGTKHQSYIEAELNLVENRFLSTGPTEEIAKEIERITKIALSLFDDVIAFGTERQRLNWLREGNLLSLPCSLGTDPAFIANTIQRTKGRLLDSMLVEQNDPGNLLSEFRTKQRKLDDLLFRFESREELRELRDEITALESQLRSTPKNEREHFDASAVDWSVVQATLPAGSAFVDYIRYENLNAGAESPLSYGAILILPEGAPRWIPLGTEENLNIWLGILKERLEYRTYLLNSRGTTTPPALRLRSALRRLHDLFWAPVAALLPAGTETVGISPDATLNFVSFAVLLDEDNKFLADTFRQMVYFSSARDLLVEEERPALTEGPWAVIAVPNFEDSTSGEEVTSLDALSQIVLETISAFPDVPGAEEELRLLHRLIPSGARGIELLNANEEQVRGLKESPVVLHLTTHAFFLPAVGDGTMSGVQDFNQQPDLFYRSGLVLTEAKRAHAARARGEDIPFDRDGVLFMDEVIDLPLHNTRLVTLSSCESGLGGLSVSGQGVLGLRQGFIRAGTSNILISLWPVSDNSTPKFMEHMYRLALATDRVGQSLWETQRRTLQNVDPNDDAELEEAILRYGCFVLCQRGPLQAAVDMPESREPFRHQWAVALGLTGIFIFLISRPNKKRSSQGLFAN
ncbi:MAG: CHAT domain-containing protein [Roseibacillus sp.]